MSSESSSVARFRTLFEAVWTFIRGHKVVSGLIILACVLYLLLCALIGMPPVAVVALPAAIAGITVVWELIRSRRGDSRTPLSGAALLVRLSVSTILVLLIAQAVPYGRAISNPPATGEPQWADPETRALMVRACYSCHSNEVEEPWYSQVAPISWMVQAHVDEGRSEVNYSEFLTNPGEAEETLEVILDGSMPPGYYTRFGLHSEARLTDEELAQLIEGVRATPGLSEHGGREGREDNGDDDN